MKKWFGYSLLIIIFICLIYLIELDYNNYKFVDEKITISDKTLSDINKLKEYQSIVYEYTENTSKNVELYIAINDCNQNLNTILNYDYNNIEYIDILNIVNMRISFACNIPANLVVNYDLSNDVIDSDDYYVEDINYANIGYKVKGSKMLESIINYYEKQASLFITDIEEINGGDTNE